ncbi:hypothetical protein [Leptotrichia trevisanii]|uniref:hypothetical protein n=1 Tax=Leptotrichia trevisanii TaxID=109328 RepID=UPI0026E96C1A|nr:hypothetical protein [Leptotrichia trevisanii]
MFDDRYYNKIIKKYKYNPMDFKPMNFYFNNISPNIMKTKWLCHSGIDKINNYSSTIISTGIGLSGVPHMGTLSQIMRSIFLQSKGFKVQFVLGDLDSYNARNQELNIVLKRAEHYKKFISKLGFNEKKGILRSQYNDCNICRDCFLISKYINDSDFINNYIC